MYSGHRSRNLTQAEYLERQKKQRMIFVGKEKKEETYRFQPVLNEIQKLEEEKKKD